MSFASINRNQQHRPTETRLAITRSSPTLHTVFEIDGLPAADAYAGALGIETSELSEAVFDEHPLIVKGPGRSFVHAPIAINADGSLQFLCGLDEGTVVRMGELDGNGN